MGGEKKNMRNELVSCKYTSKELDMTQDHLIRGINSLNMEVVAFKDDTIGSNIDKSKKNL